jgi:hexosaminidase
VIPNPRSWPLWRVVPSKGSLRRLSRSLDMDKDLSEVPGDKWPDTYCPSNPKSYELLFEVMDEYIEAMKPKLIHTGHDEWFAPFGLCPRCSGKDPGELYGQDLKRVHDYLARQGIRMAIWGDYLIERVRGKGLQKRVSPDV